MQLVDHIHHVGIVVPNLAESVQWYTEKLGFTVEVAYELPEFGLKIAYLHTPGGARVELFESVDAVAGASLGVDPLPALRVQGTAHVAFAVADADAAYAEVKARGIEVASEPVTVEAGRLRYFFVRDNAGILLEFIQKF